jgi:hypothetical protein
MAGRVFVSCGQRGHERDVAEKIKARLESKFHLTAYLAFKTQSLRDIMTIIEELRSCDYYLFVDFPRPDDPGCSLYTHQELALAYQLGFQDMIALQQRGMRQEGFLRYVLSNPEPFDSDDDLLNKVEKLIEERKWNPGFSRNLVLAEVQRQEPDPITYGDHTGFHVMTVWNAKIENRRPDVAAVRAVCILSDIETQGTKVPSPDRAYLKWCGQATYENTILPNDFGLVTLCCTHQDEPGLFLVTARDVRPRSPVAEPNEEYKLYFKLYSEGFPPLDFSVNFDLRQAKPTDTSSLRWP